MEKNYFTIKEVSKIVNLPQYTIRYWENKTRSINPIKLSSGHRRYTKKDIENILKIKDLIYINGYSLNGVRKAIRTPKDKLKSKNKDNSIYILKEIKEELQNILKDISED
jgi:DNA-binding transcriptional MerR regulator